MPEQVQLLDEFVAEEDGELSVSKGEIVTVLEKDEDGWTYVQNSGSQTGLVPSAYLQPYTPPQVEKPKPPPVSKRMSAGSNVGAKISPRFQPSVAFEEKQTTVVTPETKVASAIPTFNRSLSTQQARPKSAMVHSNQSNLIQVNPIVLRIYTNEDIHREIEEKELNNPTLLRTFKSIKATPKTLAKSIIAEVAKKLLLPDFRQFHLFQIDRKG